VEQTDGESFSECFLPFSATLHVVFWQFFRHRAQPERSDQSSDQKAKRHAKQGKTQQCEDRNDVASLLEA
jgi:hypothetical protein